MNWFEPCKFIITAHETVILRIRHRDSKYIRRIIIYIFGDNGNYGNLCGLSRVEHQVRFPSGHRRQWPSSRVDRLSLYTAACCSTGGRQGSSWALHDPATSAITASAIGHRLSVLINRDRLLIGNWALLSPCQLLRFNCALKSIIKQLCLTIYNIHWKSNNAILLYTLSGAYVLNLPNRKICQ